MPPPIHVITDRKPMPKNYKKNRAGFTLIETIIYIALFGLLIGGAVVTSFNLLEGSSKLGGGISADAEGNFILQKINWALTGITASSSIIWSPSLGSTSTKLCVFKSGLPATENTLRFDSNSSSNAITLARGTASICNGTPTSTLLSSMNVIQKNLVFTRSTTTPESIKASFQLGNRSFELTKYLRQ